MTCIVGLEHDGVVTIGGDAAAVEESRLSTYSEPKVFFVGPYLIGFCDSFRMGQLLRYRLKVPKQTTDDDMEHMCTVFVDAVRKCFHQGGFAKTTESEEAGGVFLVALNNRLYSIDSDYHVGHSRLGYDAIGCGDLIALGSMASSTGTANYRVRLALHAAATHSTSVAPPFTLLTTAPMSEEST